MSEHVVPRESPEERELRAKRQELAALQVRLAGLESDLATVRLRLAAFEDRYLRVVGRRYAELDALLAKIAALQAEEAPRDSDLHARAESAKEQARSSADAVGDLEVKPKRKAPDPALKALYREIARLVHPDLASNEKDRQRRERLMRDANLAYEAGDRARLEQILRECQYASEAIEGASVADDLVRVIRQIAQVEGRIAEVVQLLDEARSGDRYDLMLHVDAAEAEGRDLLQEMASDVDRQVSDARSRLGTMQGSRA